MKSTTNVKYLFRYMFLFLPLLLFTFCQNLGEDLVFIEEAKVTKDSKIVSLMIEAVKSNADKTLAKSDDDEQCTKFLYPMTFKVFFGDNPQSTQITINSDDELIEFLATLTSNTGFYILFPITLVDVDGVETIINDLTEFEGTLQMLVDACQGGDDDDSDDDDSDDDDDDDDSNGEYDFCHDNNKKVYICHKGQTICVSINAIWGHLNQHEEDFLGQCD